MKAFVVFEEWRPTLFKNNSNEKRKEIDAECDIDFHSGCSFPATIKLDKEQKKSLMRGIKGGHDALFYVVVHGDDLDT